MTCKSKSGLNRSQAAECKVYLSLLVFVLRSLALSPSLSLPGSEDEEEYGHDDEYLPELGALLAQEMRTCTTRRVQSLGRAMGKFLHSYKVVGSTIGTEYLQILLLSVR